MKKIYTILFIALSLNLFAQFNTMSGVLNVFTEYNEPFYLYLNGELQNTEPQVTLKIEGLTQSYYKAKIVFANDEIKPISKNNARLTGLEGYFTETTYQVKISKKNKASINLYSMTPIISHLAQPQTVVINQQYPNSPSNFSHTYEMNSEDFIIALKEITSYQMDQEKLSICENYLLRNYFSSKQIAEIASSFTFDTSRIVFAKSAYRNCIDVQNYDLVKEKFSFISYKEDLTKFISL